jgi:hypothetical protein
MKPNIGKIDRALRIILGLGLIAYGIVNHSWVGAIGAVCPQPSPTWKG